MTKFVIATALALLCLMYLINTEAYGADIDATISLATDPYSGDSTGFGTTYGFRVGGNFDLDKSSYRSKFVARADISYFKWSESAGYVSWSFSRLPLFLGGRLYTPLKIYIEGGVEFSYDKWESRYTGPLYGIYGYGQHAIHRETHLGLTPGLGAEIPLIDTFLIGVNARYHMIADAYSTLGLTIGYRF